MNKKELKPCPFCGAEIEKVKSPLQGFTMFVCTKCGADVLFYGAEKDNKKAIEKWNRRAK